MLRALAVLAAGVLAVLLSAPAAGAHAVLSDSDPPDGATLAQAPHSIRLRFTEHISGTFRSAQLVDAGGGMVAGARLRRGGDPRDLVLDLPSLPAGGYGVLWRVLAQSDGHTSSGAVVFSVGAAPASIPGVATAASRWDALAGAAPIRPLDVLRRWLGLCLLAGVIGGLAVAGLVLAPSARASGPGPLGTAISAGRRRVLAVVVGCAVAGAAVGLTDLLAEVRRLAFAHAGSALAVLTGSRWGHLWLVHQTCLIAVALLVVRLRSSADRRLPAAGLAVLAAALCVVEALGSHAASSSGPAVPILAGHVLTACIWLGALPALMVTLWPARGDSPVGPAAVAVACRRRLSLLLAASVVLLVASGLYSAGRQVADVAALGATGYGHALLVKAGLVLVMLALGAWNMARLHGLRPFRLGPARHPPSPRRSVLPEAVAGLLVLAATAVLMESVPARAPVRPPVAAPTGVTTTGGVVADLVVSVSVSPNRPGLNAFTVHANSTRRPPPAPVDGVSLRLDQAGDASTVTLREVAPGEYFGTGVLSAADQLRVVPLGVSVVVRRDGRSLAASFPWSLSDPPAPQAAAQGRRLAPYTDWLAVILLGCAVLVAAGVAGRRMTRTAPPEGAPAEDERVLEGVR